MGKRGPAPRPKLVAIKEGNPGRRTDLESGLRLRPSAPNEPDWAETFGGDDAVNERCRLVASDLWALVVEVLDRQGLLAVLDGPTLADYCVSAARVDQCERAFSMDGLFVETERGMVKHPLTPVANQYRARLKQLEGQFGMSPVARDQLPSGGSNVDGDSPFDFAAG